MLTSWPAIIFAALLHLHFPRFQIADLDPQAWMTATDHAPLHHAEALASLNRTYIRQANTWRTPEAPPNLWDPATRDVHGAAGWIVNDTTISAEHSSRLHPNQPVIRTHVTTQIAGREWELVITTRVRGFVPTDDIAAVPSTMAQRLFRQAPSDLTVIATEVLLGEHFRATMGTRLARVGMRGGRWLVRLPQRGGDGALQWRTVAIPSARIGTDLDRADFYPGVVPMTRANLLRLAFRYLRTPWRLGGGAGEIDCSGIVTNVADTMGIYGLARYSGLQIHQGKTLWTKSTHPTETLATALHRLGTQVLLLGKPGHVAIYLGERAGVPWILHAVKGYGTIISPLTFRDLDERFTTAFTF